MENNRFKQIKIRIICLFFFATLLSAFSGCSGGDTEKAMSSVSYENLMKSVNYLASGELKGRLAGSDGYNIAAEYVAGLFEKYKLEQLGDHGYFQYFGIEHNNIITSNFSIINNGKEKEYKLGVDYVCRGMTGAGDITTPVVFCGYGISEPETGYDDYKNIDVEGKIVMVFRYNPKWKPESGRWPQASPRPKARIAAEKGAVGIIFVSAPNNNPARTIIGSVAHGNGEQDIDFPQVHIDNPQSDDFFEGSNTTLSNVHQKIDSLKTPYSLPLKTLAHIVIETQYTKSKQTMNVVGIQYGSHPKLKDEFIVVGAHLDHVGGQAGEIYFPGANDNASGVAVIIEIARIFRKYRLEPKRSIIFVAFSAEEPGIYGSEYFVEQSPVPVNDIFAMINIDCVGQGDSIKVGGGKTAPELWNIAQYVDIRHTHLMSKSTWGGGGADATAFYNRGIPTLYYNTTGGYKHLHMTSDKPKTFNPVLFEKLTKNALLTVYNIANLKPEQEPKTLIKPD